NVRHAYAPARPFAKIVHWTIFIRLVALHLKGGAVCEIICLLLDRFSLLRMTVRRCLFFCLDTKEPNLPKCKKHEVAGKRSKLLLKEITPLLFVTFAFFLWLFWRV